MGCVCVERKMETARFRDHFMGPELAGLQVAGERATCWDQERTFLPEEDKIKVNKLSERQM